MATNDARGPVARYNTPQVVSFLRKTVGFADNGTELTVGVLPAGAVILKACSGVTVTEAFDAGTTNVVDVGTSDNDDLYGTDLALTATNFVPLDEAVSYRVDEVTTITATVGLVGTAATAGEAEVVIAYVPDSDG